MKFKKILLIDSSFPINVRNRKILNSLAKEPLVETRYCAWNRTAKEIAEHDSTQFIFTKTSAYGQKVKKLLNIFDYARFVGTQIKNYQPEVIIASHWDSLLMAALYKQKKQVLIYEVLDIPTSSNILIRWVLRFFEILALRRTDKLVLASRFFAPIYKTFKGKVEVIENKPYQIPSYAKADHKVQRNRLTVTFLGTVRYFDIMKNLIDASKIAEVDIEIWGDGPDEMQLKTYASSMENVRFFGRYNYDMIAEIYDNSDLIWAVYPSKDHNVKYAISNKYHECILYRKPGIFATETALGNMVQHNALGYIVNPYEVEDIAKLFTNIKTEPTGLEQRKQNLEHNTEPKFWEDIEKKLVEIILNN